MKIGLLSDTHGYLDPRVWPYLEDCDQLWHAGDIGSIEVAQTLEQKKPLIAVHGNIDTPDLARSYPANQHFVCEGFRVWLTHIAGRPGAYPQPVIAGLTLKKPDILVSGHTHLLCVSRTKNGIYHLNPGAAGRAGIHQVQTLLTFHLSQRRCSNMVVIELERNNR